MRMLNRSPHRRFAALGLSVLAVLAASLQTAGRVARADPPRPNILFILTDDQRFDQLEHMPIVQSQLVGRGVRFANGLVSDPLCCPSRATILTGTYSHTNGIYTDFARNGGGFPYFRDTTTIATVLEAQGYRTALVGKYLNDYNPENAPYIPPGWDRWFGVTKESYFHFSISNQGTNVDYTGTGQYLTDVLGQEALNTIASTPADQPLFLYWSPYAPHKRASPAKKYRDAFPNLPRLRPPSYNEKDVSDKPAYIQKIARWDAAKRAAIDAFRRRQYQSLLSVDDWVGSILDALSAAGRLDNTLIVFMSDNGYLEGEHRVDGKTVPYEESVKVPFIVRWDAAGWNVPRTDGHIVANVDLAETWAQAAGTTMPGNEGLDMLPLLAHPSSTWRTELLLEHSGPVAARPPYCGVRGTRWVYVQYATGEEELYDLDADPYQLQNVATDPSNARVLDQLRSDDHVLCDPQPPGFTWSH
jgi:N-acetylglucosamine-6-sulfatase